MLTVVIPPLPTMSIVTACYMAATTSLNAPEPGAVHMLSYIQPVQASTWSLKTSFS